MREARLFNAAFAGLLLGMQACTWFRAEPPPVTEPIRVPAEQLFEQIRGAVSSGRYELAVQLIEENYSRFEDAQTADRLNFMRGWIALSRNDYRLARLWFEQIPPANLALTPIALYYRAKCHEQAGEPGEAIALYETLIQQYPLSRRAVEARYDLATLYFRGGNFETSFELYEMMRRNANLQGEQYLANRPLAMLNSGDALAALDRKEEALARFESLYYDFPLTPEADTAAERMVHLRQELGSPPFSADPDRMLQRVRKLLDGGKARLAIQEIETVLPAHKEKGGRAAIDALTLYAQTLDRDRRFTDSRAIYDQITSMPGADVASMQLRIAQATAKSNEDLAIQRFLKVAADFPKTGSAPDALYQAARFHHVAGRDVEARGIYQRIIGDYPKSVQAASATFQMGWFDYLSGRFTEAAGWFEKASAFREDADEYERSLYWLARAREQAGQTAEAQEIYRKLWSERNWHYYGALAKGRSDGLEAQQIFGQMLPPENRSIRLDPPLLRHEPELVQISQSFGGMRRDGVPSAVELIILGLFREAADELDFVAQGNPSTEQVSRLLPLFEETRDYQRLRTWGWNTLGKPAAPEVMNVRSWRALYPKAYLDHVNAMAAENELDARFILSIIREESAYDPRALSVANAHGLMQLIPPTAEKVGKSVGLQSVTIENLRTPAINIKLGATYLRQLADEFNGNMVFATASYNGGPHNVNKWRERFGSLEMDEFVEEIPFKETRNYVKKIFKSWSNYRLLYGPDGERLYALAMEQMLSPSAPVPEPGLSFLPVHLGEPEPWVRPHLLSPPPVGRPVITEPVRLSGFDDYEETERERALESVHVRRSFPDLDGFDPARSYPAIVGDDGLPVETADSVRLSDWMNGTQP